MLVFYKTLPAATIRKDSKTTIKKINKWFKDNPKRRVCRAELWYGDVVSIKRNAVEKMVTAAAEKAIKRRS